MMHQTVEIMGARNRSIKTPIIFLSDFGKFVTLKSSEKLLSIRPA